MNSSEKSDSGARRLGNARADRLAKALLANISRRKAQARGREGKSEPHPAAASSADAAVKKDEP